MRVLLLTLVMVCYCERQPPTLPVDAGTDAGMGRPPLTDCVPVDAGGFCDPMRQDGTVP